MTIVQSGMVTVRCPYCHVIAFRRRGNVVFIRDKDGNVHVFSGVVVDTHCHNPRCGHDYSTDLTI